MKNRSRQSIVDKAAARLRGLSLAAPDGRFLGNEEALVDQLGVARNTVRQAARLLEREGMISVRCGVNGGYFAARPDLETIEHTVSSYLAAIAVAQEDVTYISSLLWVEAVRRAARLPSHIAKPMAEEFAQKVDAIAPDALFAEIMEVEQEYRTAVFALSDSKYIELIFQINYAFSQDHFVNDFAADGSEEHFGFVQAWRKAKLMELAAIMDGDEQMAMMAARHVRNILHRRVWGPPQERAGSPRGLA